MSEFSFPDQGIEIGYPWSVQLVVENVALFPAGSAFSAHVRKQISDPTPLVSSAGHSGSGPYRVIERRTGDVCTGPRPA